MSIDVPEGVPLVGRGSLMWLVVDARRGCVGVLVSLADVLTAVELGKGVPSVV